MRCLDSSCHFFISFQSVDDVAHACFPTIHCIDSIYAQISRVALSDKATYQAPHNFPAVIFGLGASHGAQYRKKLHSFPPTDPKLILLSGVMKTPGHWHEGRKHNCAVAPGMLGCHSPLVLLVICRSHCQNIHISCWSHRELSNISIHNPKVFTILKFCSILIFKPVIGLFISIFSCLNADRHDCIPVN
jgi:hypothetical protein